MGVPGLPASLFLMAPLFSSHSHTGHGYLAPMACHLLDRLGTHDALLVLISPHARDKTALSTVTMTRRFRPLAGREKKKNLILMRKKKG